MAPLHHLLFSFALSLLTHTASTTTTTTTKTPEALIFPIRKDPTTLQYLTHIHQRTPLVRVKLVVDVGGPFLYTTCDQSRHVSSSLHRVPCNSSKCSLVDSSCDDNITCSFFTENPFTDLSAPGYLVEDLTIFRSTDGSNPGPVAAVPDFLFSCAPTFLTERLARGAQGMAGFGRSSITIPTQLSTVFNIHPRFALCLTSSSKSDGVIFVGNGGYTFLPGIDLSNSLIRTPLLRSPVKSVSTDPRTSSEYFIGVSSIMIDGKAVKLNSKLLSINAQGVGGTKISTVTPYTTMERSIYTAVTRAFIRSATAKHIRRVAAAAPFKVCFDSESVPSTRVGPAVPTIDLVLHRQDVSWRIFGGNSMVAVKTGVLCLGLIDGGFFPGPAVVIGGHQLENNLLEFDLATSVLGFSSSLLFRQTTCANFNFTVKP